MLLNVQSLVFCILCCVDCGDFAVGSNLIATSLAEENFRRGRALIKFLSLAAMRSSGGAQVSIQLFTCSAIGCKSARKT